MNFTESRLIDWFMANRSKPQMRLGERERMLLIMRLSVGKPDPGDVELCLDAFTRHLYYMAGGTEVKPSPKQMCEALVNDFISKWCN